MGSVDNEEFYAKLYQKCVQEIKNIGDNHLNEPIYRKNLITTVIICQQKLLQKFNIESNQRKDLIKFENNDNELNERNQVKLEEIDVKSIDVNKYQVLWKPMEVNVYEIETGIVAEELSHSSKRVPKSYHRIKKHFKNNKNNKNVFKCHFKGCGKIYFYRKPFNKHSVQHLTAKQKYENNATNYLFIKSQIMTHKKDFKSDPNYRGLNSIKNITQFYELRVKNGIKQYICKYNKNCKFQTGGSARMARHINLVHIKLRKFKCNQINCNKVFEDPNSLREHQKNHLCGFGIINGKKLNTICGNESIYQYRKRIIVNNEKFFQCICNGCEFKTKSSESIRRHIHNQHLCPFKGK